jgi:superfamily II DNA or RNA helicase
MKDLDNTDGDKDVELSEVMKKNYSYPDADDPDLLYKIMKKREFYYHKIPSRDAMENYADIQEYRNSICDRSFSLHEHQAMLANIINPNTPFKGMLVFHGLGSGKTCAGVAIAEKFKEQVQKYGTKIYILVSGPLIKDSWKHHLIKCTGETYLKYQDKSIYVDEQEENRIKKNAINQAMQYYKFMSYRSFYKRVLGEKIVDKKVIKGSKVRVSYRKTEEGEFERDIAVDRIYNLNNSLIIIDEAHNLTGNAYGEALKHIIDNSTNLKIVLLTATPMKNLADDIIELINFLRPKDAPLVRDKIFNSHKNHLMDFKSTGMDYFQKMVKGYVSHIRGADPLTYAKRVDKGVKPGDLKFTHVIKCDMLDFQQRAYDIAIKHTDDALDRKSEAVANFVFPGFTQDRKGIVGYYGREGLNLVKNQLKIAGDQLNKKISKVLFGNANETDLLYITQDNKTITGKILRMPYLKYFSTKFYKALKKISRLYWGKKGPRTAFVYSNLVKVGIELFQEILIQNGYLEYQDDTSNYHIENNTICYFCGKTFKEHKKSQDRYSPMYGGADDEEDNEIDIDVDDNLDDDVVEEFIDDEDDEEEDTSDVDEHATDSESSQEYAEAQSDTDITKIQKSESSTDYEPYERFKKTTELPSHKFYPATFVSVTGKSTDDSVDNIPEDKKRMLDDVFNSLDNKEGKHIKLVLGSKVMNEGISLMNVGEVHVLDVYFNLGKVDQVVGRAIRNCSHHKIMSERNPFPVVNVYKYVVGVKGGLSTEEELYRKAEEKYILIKKVERAMKEVAIDCPLNFHGNMFAEEIKKHKDCTPFEGKNMCPAVCDYTNCQYKCKDVRLNKEYYDPKRNLYKNIAKNDLDYSTFTHGLARSEINYAKSKIKEMYITNYMYKLDDILGYVKNSYSDEKKDLFDEFFVYKALDELIPITSNDFNNFKDTVIDKHYDQGYLIYRNKYYIFQPFDQNEDVPIDYRTNYNKEITHKLSLYSYLKNTIEYKEFMSNKRKKTKTSEGKSIFKDDSNIYDFDSTMEYYNNRDEFKFVGIIDKELSRRKSKRPEEMKDVFKIREKRSKILEKKRGTGIPSLKGAVCNTSKNKEYLEGIAKKLGLKPDKASTRTDICEQIRKQMLLLEKYGTDKEKNKLTYLMIPANHPEFPFPYNLEDRCKDIIRRLKTGIKYKLSISTKTVTKKSGPEKGKPSYVITIKADKSLKDYEDLLKKENAEIKNKEAIINVE